jgi:hypothetical protein
MIEPLAIPILMKAVDFLFGEAQKILQERRERRKNQHQASPNESKPVPIANNQPIANSVPKQDIVRKKGVINSKESALMQTVSSSIWHSQEVEVSHLLSLLEIYKRNYYLAQEKYAKWGSALVPQVIIFELEDAENGIATTVKELKAALSIIYGKDIVIPEIDDIS